MYFLGIIGPGLVVMLADTDAGSVITAAQSGAVWGYNLLLLQLILIPILFIVQELTVRLGIVTGKGHGELIKEQFGSFWAWISVGTLTIASFGALITEFAGIGGVGLIFGIPLWFSVGASVIFLAVVALTGSYRSVEKIAILIGSFELAFVLVAVWAHPKIDVILTGMVQIPWKNSDYLYLAAANVGAVIMPWMIFYQQSAIVDKKLKLSDLRASRWDTIIGAILTQIIMASVLIAAAATIGTSDPGIPLNTVQQLTKALTPFFGNTFGTIAFSMGIIGAGMVAAIVVSLAMAWGLGEVTGYKHSLEHHPMDAPWFYTIYVVGLVLGGLWVISGTNLINLSVGVQIMNALLLPIVLGFLYLLALKVLPEKYKLKGTKAVFVGIVIMVTSGFGVFAVLNTLL
ncbi:Manganese transport protein MntH [hydrothermal vent metagenome]|uniref:Manganese transport protein MntH n=1 Tax=hydrothermal vent metagenome TaxID=652676 RepID=A0A3B1CNP2_9ZZZZ